MINTRPQTHMVTLYSRIMLLPLFAILIWGSGCSNNEKAPDVSNIKVDLKTYRFDKDLYAIDTNHIGEGLQILQTKYPDFLNYFLDTLMAYNIRGNYSDTVKGVREDLKQFLKWELEDTIMKYYPDCEKVDKELTQGFRYVKHYFHDAIIPKIIYLNMGLSKWAAFPLDNTTMCVGLDMYLGDQFPHYKSVDLQDYMRTHRREAYIPVSVFSAFYKSVHPFNNDEKTLLDLMLQRGKEQYFLHKILPNKNDSVLFGYTNRQMRWCEANESLIYNFFISQSLLYNKEANSVITYVTEGPFARGLESPSEPIKTTPGSIGSYLGYKIVSSYMAQYPKTTLRELLDQKTDPARFLDSAKFRPK